MFVTSPLTAFAAFALFAARRPVILLQATILPLIVNNIESQRMQRSYEIAADHRSGFKTKQEGDNWRTRNRVHNKIHRACRRGSMRRAVEGGKDIQRVTSMTIDMTKPFHLPCDPGYSKNIQN
eukprot:g64211.t1